MKLGSKFFTCALALSVAVALCVPAMAFAGTTATLKAGKTAKVTLYAPSATKAKATLKVKGQKAVAGVWKSSNKKVVTVKAGKVTAKKAGKATITAKFGKKTYEAKVVVKKTAISKKAATLEVGKKLTLKLKGDKIKKVQTSSDAVAVKLASNKQKVAVTAKAAGAAKVKVTSKKGKTYTCKVTVTPPVVAVTGVSFAKTTLVMKKGDAPVANPATVTPANATDKRVAYESKNPKVATVDSQGNVTAVGFGATKVTATSASGAKSDVCDVYVTELDAEQWKTAIENVDVDAFKAALVSKDQDAISKQFEQILDKAGIDKSVFENANIDAEQSRKLIEGYSSLIMSKVDPQLMTKVMLNPSAITVDDIQQVLNAITDTLS